MATTHANIPAAAPKQQPRRSVNRIIPAVPHRFSRPPAAARPLTPEDPTSGALRDLEKQPAVKSAKPEGAPVAIQTPLTPDSRVSPVENRVEDEHALSSSPAHSGTSHVEKSTDAQETEYLKQSMPAHGGLERTATPQQEQPAVGASIGDRPKSTVRTALPPEFYPREKPMGRAFDGESIAHAAQVPSAYTPAHGQQVGVEGLVFGGVAQEGPTMPPTPQDFDQGVRAQQSFARPPPGLVPPHLAPQFYPGHSHHPSEPTTPWPQPPYSMPMPPEAIYASGNDYHSSAYPPGSGAFQAPFAAPFSPRGGPVSLNGFALRSRSQSPSRSLYGEASHTPIHGEEPQNGMYSNGLPSAKQIQPAEGYDMLKHLFSQFGNPEFSDYVLQIRSPDAMLWTMHVHATIVSRSPVVFEALRRSTAPPFQTKDTRRLAEVITDDRFVTPESLNEAIKILYAAPLLPADAFTYNLSPYDPDHDQDFASNEARKRMGQAISYAAAGRVLQIHEMQACGLRIAKSLIRWDTLDIVLQYGLSVNMEAYAVPLLDDVLGFIAYNFPMDFKLYSIAPELRQTPRLPAVVEVRQPSHNPRLSKIRFGDAPPEDEIKPSPIAQALSSVLLSVPLALLDRLFSHPAAANQIGWSGLVKAMREVIEEREKRRQKALKFLEMPLDTSVSRAMLDNLYLEERVEPTVERASGFKPVAVRTPDSM